MVKKQSVLSVVLLAVRLGLPDVGREMRSMLEKMSLARLLSLAKPGVRKHSGSSSVLWQEARHGLLCCSSHLQLILLLHPFRVCIWLSLIPFLGFIVVFGGRAGKISLHYFVWIRIPESSVSF